MNKNMGFNSVPRWCLSMPYSEPQPHRYKVDICWLASLTPLGYSQHNVEGHRDQHAGPKSRICTCIHLTIMSLLGWLWVYDGELDKNSLCPCGCITSKPWKSPFLSIFSLFLLLIPHMLYGYLLLVRLCSIMNMTDKRAFPSHRAYISERRKGK